MGAFSQIFHLNRMIGGSTDKLAIPDARAQHLGGRSHCRDVGKQSSLQAIRTEEAEMGTHLRKILDAKQEPFVLQEVIWEKRHPVRTRSSRELKFELNDMVPSSSKSGNPKRTKSKNSRRHSDAGCDGLLPAPSSTLVKDYNVPAESMVALPSPQASLHGRKTCPISSKTFSAGKSPVKSPNKRALLMEAAAKILEGSNRQASKLPSSSARSLLRELDGSKRAQELSKSKEALSEKFSAEVEPTLRHKSLLQNVFTLEQRLVEQRNQHHHAVNQSQQDLASLNISSAMTEEVNMAMQSRIYPSLEMPAARGELSSLADHFDVLHPSNQVQSSNGHFAKDITKKETLITLVDVSMERVHRMSELGPSDVCTHRESELDTVSEVIGREHRQLDRIKDLESVPYAHLSTKISVNGLPLAQELVNSLEWNIQLKHSQADTSNELHELHIPRKARVDDIHCNINSAGTGNFEIGIRGDDCAHAFTLVDIDLNGVTKSCTKSDCKTSISKEMATDTTESDTTEKPPTPVLLLCNYSWWKQEEMQAFSSTLKNETSNDRAGCNSPLVAAKGPCVVKILEERKEVGSLEENSSISSDHSYVEEFQQSSPVSVLDVVYDDGEVLGKPFDYFHEARQKLLESVRRYEMLADMDLDMLMKINENSHCLESEEESDSSSLKESWGCDAADTCANRHQVPSMASPDYQSSRYRSRSKMEADGLSLDSACGSHYEAIEDDIYILSDDDFHMQRLWEMTDENARSTADSIVDIRARFNAERESTLKALLDFASEPPDLHTSKGPRMWSAQTNSPRGTLDEAERLPGSVVINAMLHLDITTNHWSSFHEEVVVMEMELESSLFATLMQELLLDLQY
ncbi:hypothetical protein L7F22_064613 [Adiantum nelumboides]|nr:hypothetical protein [Adiantum nelumboides]